MEGLCFYDEWGIESEGLAFGPPFMMGLVSVEHAEVEVRDI